MSERKTSKCNRCGAEIIWIEYLGTKHPVDAKPKRGFIFIEDEYGNDIGSVEMAAIHESHFATCPEADKLPGKGKGKNKGMKSPEVSPLAKNDKRVELLTMADGSEMIIEPEMRAEDPDAYKTTCKAAIERSFPEEN